MRWLIPLTVLPLSGIGACAVGPYDWDEPFGHGELADRGPADPDDSGDDDPGDDDPGDDDPGDDTAGDDDGDDDSDGEMALVGYFGRALVQTLGYAGTEELYFSPHGGVGLDLCRIRYSLVSTAVRDDCEDCVWAFELSATEPEIIAGSAGDCEALGYDAVAIDELLSRPRAYGYAPEYYGHANVLLVSNNTGGWDVVSFAAWSDGGGQFSYNWEIGYQMY